MAKINEDLADQIKQVIDSLSKDIGLLLQDFTDNTGLVVEAIEVQKGCTKHLGNESWVSVNVKLRDI